MADWKLLHKLRRPTQQQQLNSSSEPPDEEPDREEPEAPKEAARSKLRSTSRAILLIRRAASALSSNQEQTASISRQETSDSLAASTCSAANQSTFIVPRLNALRLPIVCLIRSLEGELMREVFVHRYELGQYLIESLKVSLGLVDSKYLGLRLARTLDEQEDVRNPWLDLNELVCKQIKSRLAASSKSSSVEFYLRLKFYPPNLARVQDAFLRHYLWLQLRRDLRLGKLTSSMNNLAHLMACVLQYELGDQQDSLLAKVPQLTILPNQDLVEASAVELWRTRLKGSLKHQAQMQFLRAAIILETYGFDYYPVRDHQRQRAYLLGFNYAGVKTIRNGQIVHHFRWHSLSKISQERRMIIFHIYPTEKSKRKQILGFKCLSNEDCQNLYMRLLEQKYFFTVDLAYFDTSVRPSQCLHESAANLDSEWATDSRSASLEMLSSEQHPHQHHPHPHLADQNLSSGSTSLGAGISFESSNSSATDNCRSCQQELSKSSTMDDQLAASSSRWPLQESLEEPQRAEVSVRRATWRRSQRHQPARLSDSDQPEMEPIRVSSTEPNSLQVDSGWLSGCARRLKSQLSGESVFELAESILVPPMMLGLSASGRSGMARKMLHFCLLILLLNLLLKLSDFASTRLIELLSV